jgi:thioredoxin reductase
VSEPVVAIVGAGVTGLACAAALAPHARAEVVDRIPVIGGVLGWDHPASRGLASEATATGARLHLGETAIRWDGYTLMAIGPDGVRRIEASALVIAAGSRPLGRAELGLTGPRPAGILPATVACHLSETGLLIGRRPAVIGGGDWAARALERLLHAGADTIELIAPAGILRPLPESEQITRRTGTRPVAVEGVHRVTGVRIDGGERIDCDAVVLAHELAPLRNVDGAVWEGPRTVFAQPGDDPTTIAAAITAGQRAAAAALELIG